MYFAIGHRIGWQRRWAGRSRRGTGIAGGITVRIVGVVCIITASHQLIVIITNVHGSVILNPLAALGQKFRTIHHVVLHPQAILVSTRSIGIVVSAVSACGEESEQTLVN